MFQNSQVTLKRFDHNKDIVMKLARNIKYYIRKKRKASCSGVCVYMCVCACVLSCV